MKSHDGNLSYYLYDPSVAAGAIAAVLYGLTACTTIFQYIHYRSWFFWPCVLGALMEAIGFIFRALSASDVTNRNEFIIQYCMVILAPAILAAGCYMVFGRLLVWVVPESQRGFRQMWVPVRWITPIFVIFDVLSFLIQLFGAVSVSGADQTDVDRIKRGQNVIKIGLAVQLVCFGFFTIIGIRFLFTSRNFASDVIDGKKWRHLNYAVNIACGLILVRSCYRMGEFSASQTAKIQTQEVWFWIFDALMMLIMLVTFNIFHPGRFLPNLGFRQNVITKKTKTTSLEMQPSDHSALMS